MTELEKLDARIAALERASLEVQVAASLERKLTHDQRTCPNLNTALVALGDQLTKLRNLRTRIITL